MIGNLGSVNRTAVDSIKFLPKSAVDYKYGEWRYRQELARVQVQSQAEGMDVQEPPDIELCTLDTTRVGAPV
jgi:hypothetical protein